MDVFANASSALSGAGGDEAQRFYSAVIESSAVLEAFGCAEMPNSSNSSRYVRWVQLQFGWTGDVQSGRVRPFLLEQSRVVAQDEAERNFHAFYYLLVSGPDEVLTELGVKREIGNYSILQPIPFERDDYGYQVIKLMVMGMGMGRGATLEVRSHDLPTTRWLTTRRPPLTHHPPLAAHRPPTRHQDTTEMLTRLGLASDKVASVWRMMACILHLNSIRFASESDHKKGGAVIETNDNFASKTALERTARLLGCEPDALEQFLTTMEVSSAYLANEGVDDKAIHRNRVRVAEAERTQRALSCALYGNMFCWLARHVSGAIAPPHASTTEQDQETDDYSFSVGIMDSVPYHTTPPTYNTPPTHLSPPHPPTVGIMDSVPCHTTPPTYITSQPTTPPTHHSPPRPTHEAR